MSKILQEIIVTQYTPMSNVLRMLLKETNAETGQPTGKSEQEVPVLPEDLPAMYEAAVSDGFAAVIAVDPDGVIKHFKRIVDVE